MMFEWGQNTMYLPSATTNIAELRLDILYPNILYATLINHTLLRTQQ